MGMTGKSIKSFKVEVITVGIGSFDPETVDPSQWMVVTRENDGTLIQAVVGCR